MLPARLHQLLYLCAAPPFNVVVTFGCIVQQGIIRVSSFQLSLPNVVMCVDEARTDYLIFAIDDSTTVWRRNILINAFNKFASYKQIHITKDINIVRCVMLEYDPSLKKK